MPGGSRWAALLASAVGLLFLASPTLAEVCDKERPDWSPADGPVTMLGETLGFLSSPIGLALMGMVLAAFLVNKLWTSLVCGFVMAMLAVAFLGEALQPIEIALAARQEGCTASPLLTALILLVLAPLLVWRSWRTRRGRKRSNRRSG